MSNFTQEQIEAAKAAKSPEELVAMAKEAGQEITLQQAESFLAGQKQGELADEELDNVAGGGCHNDGWLVVTVGLQSKCFVCKHCEKKYNELKIGNGYGLAGNHKCEAANDAVSWNCNNCKWCSYEKALWLCKNPDNRKD